MQSPRWSRSALVAVLAALAPACTEPLRVHRGVDPRAAILAAEQAGADEDRWGAVYLSLAREDLATAASSGTSTARGARAADRARVDAELAHALARSSKQRAEALAARRELEETMAKVAEAGTR